MKITKVEMLDAAGNVMTYVITDDGSGNFTSTEQSIWDEQQKALSTDEPAKKSK